MVKVLGKCKLYARTHTHTDGQHVHLELVQCPGQHVCVLPDGSVNHPIRLGKVNVDSSLYQFIVVAAAPDIQVCCVCLYTCILVNVPMNML